MKKRFLLMAGILMTLTALASCGKSSPDGGTGRAATGMGAESRQEELSGESGQAEVESPVSDREESSSEDLPYWKGVRDYFGYSVYTTGDTYVGTVSIYIDYPSLTPTSFGWAYQKDPAYVFVTGPGFVVVDGKTNVNENKLVDSLEDTFEVTKPQIYYYLEDRRDYHYDNFDFTVETAEPVTIHDFPMYKYTGIHTYTYDEEDRQCDFVAYSVDTGQAEHSYLTLIVVDDSLSNPSQDPLPEGTVEAYARKMAESIVLDE